MCRYKDSDSFPEMTPIQEFYNGRSVLITGGTGFMGKVLLEKMVRSVTHIKRIYVLVRPKKGLTPEERIQLMVTKWPFTFCNTDPSKFKKLVALHGDTTKEGLGLSAEDKQKVIDEVSVVINAAANIRMNLSLKEAVIENTLSTLRVLNLCTEMKNLVSVLHLSTAYCNIEIEHMEEKVYPCNMDPYKIIDMVQWMDDKSLAKLEKSIIKPHPNTYTFSKRLAELIAYDMGKKLPLIINRPSIVLPALKEPVPGWVDNLNGACGIFVGCGTGVIRSVLADKKNVPQVIPVDIAANGSIVLSYLRATQKFEDTPVFNATQGDIVRMNWEEVETKVRVLGKKHPLKKMLWYPTGAPTTTNAFLHRIYVIFFHFLPAYVIDFLLTIFMQKPFLVQVQKRINLGLDLLSYFALRQFTFVNENTLQIERLLVPEDKKVFYLQNVEFDIDDYLQQIFIGERKYCMNDNMDNITQCKIQYYFLFVLDRFCRFMIFYGLIWLVLWMFNATYMVSYKYWFQNLF